MNGTCARCLGTYPFQHKEDFQFVLKPAGELSEEDEGEELAADDVSLSFYSGDEVDLSPLIGETMMLSLPTRPLCGEECRGLCPRCGANRNTTECGCRDDWADPRLEVLHKLKR